MPEPSERRYREPFAADRVGAPEPKNIPKFDVEETRTPAPAVPPAGMFVSMLARRLSPAMIFLDAANPPAVLTAAAFEALASNVPPNDATIAPIAPCDIVRILTPFVLSYMASSFELPL